MNHYLLQLWVYVIHFVNYIGLILDLVAYHHHMNLLKVMTLPSYVGRYYQLCRVGHSHTERVLKQE